MPERVAQLQREAEDPRWLDAWLVQPSLWTGNVEFFSDLPAKTDEPHQRDARAFTRHVMKLVASAHREVVLQTPYLVMSHQAQKIFRLMHERSDPPHIIVSTNSLASTDAFAVYAMSYKHRKRYLNTFGFDIHEMKPHPMRAALDYRLANLDTEQDEPAPAVAHTPRTARRRPRLFGSGSNYRPAPLKSEGRRFGLHAKSIVIDDDVAMVGSHNFDPRSDHYNTEAGVIVYDKRFAEQLRRQILHATQPQNSWVIAPRRAVVPVLTDINQAIGTVSEHLPLFDLWPFRYATSYQLKSGCLPMRASNPRFYQCYEPVGDFPDVALSPKWIITRLITAFGAGVKGVM